MTERITDRFVLLVISAGLITILLAIIAGIYATPRALPNWAENVLVAIGSMAGLKLGDCLATLVALSSGKSVERLGTQLAQTQPATDPPPANAAQAGRQVAEAAADTAERIEAQAGNPDPERKD